MVKDIEALFLDFDGVFTNNKVYMSSTGEEFVQCNRSDGLAFDLLRKFSIPVFVISTEKNPVVSSRCKKLKIDCFSGVKDKVECIKEIVSDSMVDLDHCVYIGNDLNDLEAMKLFGYCACPSDSHYKIIDLCNIFLDSRGGDGVIREFVEREMELFNDFYYS